MKPFRFPVLLSRIRINGMGKLEIFREYSYTESNEDLRQYPSIYNFKQFCDSYAPDPGRSLFTIQEQYEDVVNKNIYINCMLLPTSKLEHIYSDISFSYGHYICINENQFKVTMEFNIEK